MGRHGDFGDLPCVDGERVFRSVKNGMHQIVIGELMVDAQEGIVFELRA